MNKEKQTEKKRIRRVRLVDCADIQRYTAWLARRVEAGVVECETAKGINALLRTFLRAWELGQLKDLESRLTELEKLSGENKR